MAVIAAASYEDLEVNGFIKNQTAYRFRKDQSLTKLLNIFQLKSSYTINSKTKITGIGRIFYDSIYDIVGLDKLNITRDLPEREELKDLKVRNKWLLLRELYMDIFLSNLDIRIGKQIVRWGIIEGYRITDEINPLDFNEFILRDLEERYIPLWLIKADYYIGKYSIEGLLIPDLKFNKPAPNGTEFEEFQLPPDIKRPPLRWENSEIGIKVSTELNDYEITGSYLYTWDDFPAAFRSVFGLGKTFEDVSFTPRYTRLNIFGGTFAKNIKGLVIGGEGAFITGKFFASKPAVGNKSNEVKKDHIKYGILFNISKFDMDFTLQFSQQIILDYEPSILEDKTQNIISLFSRTERFHNRLAMQFFILYMVSNSDFLFRPRVDYRLTDQIVVSLGSDLFQGKMSKPEDSVENFHFIGFFNNNDRVYVELKYSF